MNRRQLPSLGAKAAGGLLLVGRTGADERSSPNVIYVLVDDMGYGDPRCYDAESPAVHRGPRERGAAPAVLPASAAAGAALARHTNEDFAGHNRAGPYGDFVTEVDATVGAILDAPGRTRLMENPPTPGLLDRCARQGRSRGLR